MGAVGVEEAAAVRPQHLDGLLRGHRAERDDLPRPLDGLELDVRRERLHHPLGDQEDGDQEREGQEHVEGGPDEIDPEVPERPRATRAPAAGQPPRQGQRHADAGGRGREVVPGEAGHLGQVAHRRLARIGLPVRVGGEAHRGVPGQRRGDLPEAVGVERQQRLEAEDGVGDEQAHRAEDEQRDRVRLPVLLPVRVHPAGPEDEPLHRTEQARERSRPALEDAVEPEPDRLREQQDEEGEEPDLEPAVDRHGVP